MQLDSWQQEVLDHDGNILLNTGRQNGKTFIMSRKAAKYLLKHPKSQIIVVSLTEDQAHLMIIMILDYLQRNHKKLIAKGRKAPTKSSITLLNGSKVVARPVGNTGDAVRGFTGDVLIIDEASRMNEFIFQAAKPVLFTRGGQIWICSTPFGKQGYFYESWLNKHNRFKVFQVNSEEVAHNREICETWTAQQKQEAIRHLEEEKKDMSDLAYGQEYLALFQEDLQAYFTDELIDKCCTEKRSDFRDHRKYVCGVDIARLGKDETAFSILDATNPEQLTQTDSLITKKQLLTQTADKIVSLHTTYNFKKIYIDTGGVGAGVYDILLRETRTKNKIVSINNASKPLNVDRTQKTKILKEDLYQNLLALMQRGKIKLLDNEKLRLSLKSIQWEYKIREGEKTRMRIFGSYSHIVEGLIRAAWCYKDKTLKIWVRWS